MKKLIYSIIFSVSPHMASLKTREKTFYSTLVGNFITVK